MFERLAEEEAWLKRLIASFNIPFDAYMHAHIRRFAAGLCVTPQAASAQSTALDIGYTNFLMHALRARFGYGGVAGTDFAKGAATPAQFVQIPGIGDGHWYKMFEMNLERDRFDSPDGAFDFVQCLEVIEHMDVDPMFFMSELNRVTTLGGRLLMTTPNSASSRIVKAVLGGYRPHFFMQYEKIANPYRHNFEYDVHALRGLLEASGFQIDTMVTIDTFNGPLPEIDRFLAANGCETANRGDNIFALATKVSGVRDRYPDVLYV